MESMLDARTSRELPSLSGNLLLGNLREFMDDPVQMLIRGYREHGPIFRIRALHRRYVAMVGREAMRFLSKNEKGHFSMGPVYGEFNALWGAEQSIISVDGAQHAAIRKLMRPTMAKSTLEKRIDPFFEVTLRELERASREGEQDLLQLARKIVFEQLAVVMDFDAIDSSEYYEDIVRAHHTALEVGVTHRWPRFMAWLPGFRRAMARAHEYSALVRAHNAGREREGGILEVIRRLVEEDLLDERDVPMVTLIPFLAGMDTVASSLAFAIAATFRDDELVASLREEASGALADRSVSTSQVPRIDALKTEVLRRYPVTVASIRRCVEPFEFEGHLVEAGQDVMFAIAAQLFMEEHYDEPLAFRPDRFLGPDAAKREAGVFTPFGVGSHACLGTGLAEVQLTGTLAALLARCDVDLSAKSRPIDMQHVPFPVPYGERVSVRMRP